MEKVKIVGIKFNYLTEQEQYELYTENKEKYRVQASKSPYSSIRQMVAKDNYEEAKLSKNSEFLNQLFRDEIRGSRNASVMREIINNESLTIEKDTLHCLIENLLWW